MSNKNITETKIDRFPCSQCGALLVFKPGSQHLTCQYCGTENEIPQRFDEIREYDFSQALKELAHAKPAAGIAQIHCDACGAGFKFASSVHAGDCPFCGAAIVTSTEQARPITPKSLLPFAIDHNQAKHQFRQWLNSLWFAPSKVKKYADSDAKLTGVYIPYWTFDSDTETDYFGARGDIYYVSEEVQTVRDGKLVTEVRQVQHINWTPVSGRVERFFDDVLVGASRSLPRQIIDQLEPWDLANLIPYDESYLSGFNSEYYQVNLDQGFDEAKRKMDNAIYRDIAFDIGGDQQRIDRFNTRHSNTTFKHCLLPVWSAAFRYQNKAYRFIINGRTGKVQGERPYSYWKIAFAVIAGTLALAGILMLLDRSGMLQQAQTYR
ncbi:MAG: primosomal protein N' (replication factor Y) - superfamily II helicase [Methylococcaceae bacterium]|nr:primosomal protein N' (replication factor Y) - superfamily II helicase [Methylococcaceae bacterium]